MPFTNDVKTSYEDKICRITVQEEVLYYQQFYYTELCEVQQLQLLSATKQSQECKAIFVNDTTPSTRLHTRRTDAQLINFGVSSATTDDRLNLKRCSRFKYLLLICQLELKYRKRHII